VTNQQMLHVRRHDNLLALKLSPPDQI
jgi:hypothetical protein